MDDYMLITSVSPCVLAAIAADWSRETKNFIPLSPSFRIAYANEEVSPSQLEIKRFEF